MASFYTALSVTPRSSIRAVSFIFSRPYTNGRASVSSVCLSAYRGLSVITSLCIVAKRCIPEQKLLLTAYVVVGIYDKSIGTKMNDLDLCLEVA